MPGYRRSSSPWPRSGEGSRRVDDVLVALERLAITAGDGRAAGDLAALAARRRSDGLHAATTVAADAAAAFELATESCGTYLDRIERTLASNGDLLPSGIPPTWLGANFEVHGLPTSAQSTISYAVRWHGDRPAVLWEQSGMPVTLTSTRIDPTWTTTAVKGEALWQAQDSLAAPTRRSEPGDESVSFG